MDIIELAKHDARYAAMYFFETGDDSLLPDGPAWLRGANAYPDQHERFEHAKFALSWALGRVRDDGEPFVWVLFGGDPNTARDPYPDVIAELDDQGNAVLRIA